MAKPKPGMNGWLANLERLAIVKRHLLTDESMSSRDRREQLAHCDAMSAFFTKKVVEAGGAGNLPEARFPRKKTNGQPKTA